MENPKDVTYYVHYTIRREYQYQSTQKPQDSTVSVVLIVVLESPSPPL